MKSPAQITNDILLHLVMAVLLLALVPPGIACLMIIRIVDAIGDTRAWTAFAKVWWGSSR